jgi:hypothetical protein
MKFLKKVLTIIIIGVFFIILALWSPWYKLNLNFLNLFGIESVTKFAILKVKSLNGEINIYVDNELKGTATDNMDFTEISQITPGEHTVSLKRNSNGNYYQFERKVNFEASLDVILTYDLGPSQLFSEGHLLYSQKNFLNLANPRLTIYSAPDNVEVYIDEKLIGNSVIKDFELDISKQHKLKLIKKGYDTMEVTLLPEEQSDRDKLKNYDLIFEVNLFTQPIKINNTII